MDASVVSIPPPMPATTRPNIITHSVFAKPQMRFPRAKKIFEKSKPDRREKISVNLPLRGWDTELAMKYAEASQENRVKESNEVDIGADNVAMS